MKILYLNCWHGKLEKEMLGYISDQMLTTDIFCLQEVPPELQQKLALILPNYNTFYKSIRVKNKFTEYYGQSVFVKKGIKIIKNEVAEIFKNRKPNYGFLQIVDLELNGNKISVGNLHGRPQPGHKLDTKTRIAQSKRISESFENRVGIKIIGGDFNLEPETRSVKIIEESGFLSLISKFKIPTTRNEVAWRQSKENDRNGIVKYYKKQYFADYCFVSPDTKVKSFEVPNVDISDHLPLILEI